jgi:ABC-type uncharacterized transport system fused permease/ATPase subunit
VDVAIMPGEKVLITGESGCGKTTLARAIAGAWTWGSGEICVRAGAKLAVLPQHPYLPMGTLRRAVTYPEAPECRSTEEITAALDKAGLRCFAARLDEGRPWDQILSGGEKQRLAFARILLRRPDIIVLDEATAALDQRSQTRMMELLLRELPGATVVSIGHRAELADFHDRKITLAHGARGATVASDRNVAHDACPPDRRATAQGMTPGPVSCRKSNRSVFNRREWTFAATEVSLAPWRRCRGALHDGTNAPGKGTPLSIWTPSAGLW